MKLLLPHDNWADLREPDEIPRKPARAFRKALTDAVVPIADDLDPSLGEEAMKVEAAKRLMASADAFGLMDDLAEALVLAVVADWSFGPVDMETLDTIPDAAVDIIYAQCQGDGYLEKLMPSFGVSPDEDSPTTPS